MTERIAFVASVAKVQTLCDNGLRVTLDLSEDAVMQAAQLMECRRAGVALEVECEAIESAKEEQRPRFCGEVAKT